MADEKDGKNIPNKKDIEDAAEAFDSYLERERESLKIAKERAAFSGQFVESLAMANREQELILRKLAQQVETYHKIEDAADRDKLAKSMLEAAEAAGLADEVFEGLRETLENIHVDLDRGFKVDKGDIDALKDLKKQFNLLAAGASQAEVATKGLSRSIGSLVGGLNLGITSSTGFASSIMQAAGHLKTLRTTTKDFSLAQFGLAMAGEAAIGVLNKMGSEVSNLAKEFTKGAAAAARLSGAVEKNQTEFSNLSDGLLSLGVTTEQIGTTLGNLRNITMLLGESLNDSENSSVQLASKLVALGFDVNSLGSTINLLNRGFGMGFEESTKFLESLVINSKMSGQSVADLAKNFQQAEGRLAATAGSSAQLAIQFQALNKLAKETGTSVGALISVARGFDKFGDAADKVGKLNAQFNLGLSMSQMMRADDAERIQAIRDGFQAQGLQVSMMGKYEKLHIQSILNAKDEAEMLKILGQRRHDETETQATLNDLLEAQQGAYEKLKNSLKEFAATLAPVINIMLKGVEVLAAIIAYAADDEGLGNYFARFAVGVVILGLALGALASALGMVGMSLMSVGKIAKASTGVITQVGTSLSTVLSTMDPRKILALGAAFLMAGAGVGLAAYGFAELAKSMALLGPEQAGMFVAALGIILLGVIGFSLVLVKTLPLLVGALGTFAGGMAILTLGLVGAGFAIKLIFDSIGNAAKSLGALAEGSFSTLIDGMTTLGQMDSPLSAMLDDLRELNDVAANMDGLVISQVSEGKRTVMMASENILKGKAENSIDVNVKISMDDLNVENLNKVNVYLDGEKLAENVAKRMGG